MTTPQLNVPLIKDESPSNDNVPSRLPFYLLYVPASILSYAFLGAAIGLIGDDYHGTEHYEYTIFGAVYMPAIAILTLTAAGMWCMWRNYKEDRSVWDNPATLDSDSSVTAFNVYRNHYRITTVMALWGFVGMLLGVAVNYAADLDEPLLCLGIGGIVGSWVLGTSAGIYNRESIMSATGEQLKFSNPGWYEATPIGLVGRLMGPGRAG